MSLDCLACYGGSITACCFVARKTKHTNVTVFNFLISMSDQERISPYNIKQTSDENKEKF